jgi:phosphatidylethanolamine-binding protein (PEBP) family uncharacterized protein
MAVSLQNNPGGKMFNSDRELIDDMTSTKAVAEVITWTTNEPTASYAVTIADGDAVTSTETGQVLKTHNTQITAIIAELLEFRTAINS